MKFKININYNISKKPVKQGTRKSYINHERRNHRKYSNKSIDPNLSKYNAYHTYMNYDRAVVRMLKPYIKAHNNLKSVKNNPSRKIKSVHQFMLDRGTKIPYKFITLKMGNAQTKKNLINLFRENGFSRQDYSNAINNAFNAYAINHNKHSKYLHYDHLDTNLDEKLGGDHAHIGCLSTARTSSGKVSMSFDRGTKCQYKGRNNRISWQLMQKTEAHHFLHFATKSFQQYLGPQFTFQLSRRPNHNLHLEHNEFIKMKKSNDMLKKALQSVVNHNDWLNSDDEAKNVIIERLVNKLKKITKNSKKLVEKYQNLKQILIKWNKNMNVMCGEISQMQSIKQLQAWADKNQRKMI